MKSHLKYGVSPSNLLCIILNICVLFQASEINKNTRAAVSKMSFLKQLEWGVTTHSSEDGAAKNCLAFPALPPPQEEANGEGEDGAEAPKSDSPRVEYVGIQDLVDGLRTSLPDTKMRVFKVPAQKRNK